MNIYAKSNKEVANYNTNGPHGYVANQNLGPHDYYTTKPKMDAAGDPNSSTYTSCSTKYLDYPPSRPYTDTEYSQTGIQVDTRPASDRDAVITALRNLQDKIKHLEIERTRAEKNLQSLASETEQYKTVLTSGKPAGASRTHQDKQTDKDGDFVVGQSRVLEGQLSSAEHRCHLLEKQLQQMRKLVANSQRNQQELVEQVEKTRQKKGTEGTDIRQHMDRLNELEMDQTRLTTTQTLAEAKIRELERTIKEEKLYRQTIQERTGQLESAAHGKKVLSSQPTTSSSTLSHAAVRSAKTQVLKMKKPSKKKKATPLTGPASTCRPEPSRHYRLNLAEIPFVAGKSTGPSHALGANVQKVLAMMKLHNNALCSQAHANGETNRSDSPSSTGSSVAIDHDLGDLLIQLQDEFGQLSSKHQEIVDHIYMARDFQVKERLKQELDILVAHMENKSQQISKIRQHQRKTEDAKKIRTPSAKKSDKSKRPHTATSKLHHHHHYYSSNTMNRVKPKPHSCNKAVGNSALGRPELFMLRDMKKLQTTLRRDDLCWE